MLRRPLPALLTPMLVGLLCVVCLAPASAQSLVQHDRRGDVWRAPAVGEYTPAPHQRMDDIRSAVFRHRKDRVIAFVRYVALRRAGAYANYTLRLRTGSGLLREITVEAARHDWRGNVRVFRRHGHPVPGCQPRHRISYARNTVRIVVPTGCLHDPAVVRASYNSYRAVRPGTFFSDNAHDGQAYTRAWTDALTAEPGRVR